MKKSIHRIALRTLYNFGVFVTIAGVVSLHFSPAAHAVTPTINEFTLPTNSAIQWSITNGSDGNLWFTEQSGNKIGRVTPSGVITEFSVPTPSAGLSGIVDGPDGNLWFTEAVGNKIGRITSSGTITEFTIPTASSGPFGITLGPDGNLWFTEAVGNKIGRITPSGMITEFTVPTAASLPASISAGPDGNLWFSEAAVSANKIGRITPSGVITEFAIPTLAAFLSQLTDITAGPDGNIWFTESRNTVSKIGRITPSGVITEFSLAANREPVGITTGPDGNLWVAQLGTNRIAQITPTGVVTEVSLGTAASPFYITTGPDGNIWFTEFNTNHIGRLTLIPSTTTPDGSTTSTVAAGDSFPLYNPAVQNNHTLVLDGSVCDVTVQSGGTLEGTGHACTISVQPGGTIAPGHSPGCLSSGHLTLSGTYSAEIAGPIACSQYDQLQVTGNVTVGGTLNISLLNNYQAPPGTVFTLITNDGTDPIAGTFTGLPDGSTMTIGSTVFTISYHGGDGNDLTLTAQAGVPVTGVGQASIGGFLVSVSSIVGGLWLVRHRFSRRAHGVY